MLLVAPAAAEQSSVPVHIETGGKKLAVETGGTAQVKSGGTFQIDSGATVIRNAAETKGGITTDSSPQIGRLSWITSASTATVSGLGLPSSSYGVFLMPTANVTPIAITINSADSFTVQLQAAPPGNVSQTFFVVPTGNW